MLNYYLHMLPHGKHCLCVCLSAKESVRIFDVNVYASASEHSEGGRGGTFQTAISLQVYRVSHMDELQWHYKMSNDNPRVNVGKRVSRIELASQVPVKHPNQLH